MSIDSDKFISAMTDGFDCRRCGTCCSVWKIPITDDDIINEPKLVENVENGFINKMIGNVISACPYYDILDGCTIYDTRPQACRDFKASPLKCMAAKINTTGLDVGKTVEEWKNQEIEEIVILSRIHTMYVQILSKILSTKKRIIGGKTIKDDLENDFLLKIVKDRTLEVSNVG